MPDAASPRRKRILFLHPNFPAQFKHLASAAASSGHDARFLCQTHYERTLPGVQRLTLKGHCGHEHLNALGGDLIQRSAALANQYRRGFVDLKNSGWQPDVVVSHSGWGCGLHVREVWPDCHHVAYVEWWFDPQSDFFHYDAQNLDLNLSPSHGAKLWLRNQALALELLNANAIVAPTRWQARQLPPLLQERCHIIHDGVDLSRFKPDPTQRQRNHLLVTYGTRGMEPMRGFPQFIESLFPLLKRYSQLRVQIAGEDSRYYGGRPPKTHTSWGQWAKDRLTAANFSDRVQWLGHLAPDAYVNWLQSSDCHVHLSHPFVASWSLLEALACRCPMVVSDVEPVRELCDTTRSIVTYVDHRDPEALPQAISATLKQARDVASQNEPSNFSPYSKTWCLEQWSHVARLELTTRD